MISETFNGTRDAVLGFFSISRGKFILSEGRNEEVGLSRSKSCAPTRGTVIESKNMERKIEIPKDAKRGIDSHSPRFVYLRILWKTKF